MATDLACDDLHCDAHYLARDTLQQTIAGARAAGWRVYYGTLHSGEWVSWATCPYHSQIKREPVPQVLEGQMPLFDEED